MCTLSTVLHLASICLTLFLIYQELVNYLVIKPTTLSSEERALDLESFPQISVCLEPGLNEAVLSKHGYKVSSSFYRGTGDGRKFIAWNGFEGEKNSTKILEDAFTMKLDQQFFKKILYYTPENKYKDATVSFNEPMYPRGRCILVSSHSDNGSLTSRYLFVLNRTFAWPMTSEPFKLTVHLTDPVNTIQVNPIAFQMKGKIVSYAKEDLDTPNGFNYKIRTSKVYHVKNDPVLDCND